MRADLAFFSTLVKSGSLTAAAREYGVTPSAVSKWLAQLEARLGVRLVTRSTRRIGLTDEGETYLAEGRRILAEIEELERAVASGRAEPRGLLKVNATLGFGRNFIAPALCAFASRHPQVEVQLLLTDRPLNLEEEAVDVGIRFGLPPDSRLVVRRIADHRRRIVASPAYLKRAGRPQTPHDLASHQCLLVRQDEVAYRQWHFTRGKRTESVKVRGTLSTNDGSAALAWALEGHGILMRSEWDTAPHVRSGRLEVLLADYELPPADIHAVFPQKRNLPAKVRAFVDFLTERFGRAAGTKPIRW